MLLAAYFRDGATGDGASGATGRGGDGGSTRRLDAAARRADSARRLGGAPATLPTGQAGPRDAANGIAGVGG